MGAARRRWRGRARLSVRARLLVFYELTPEGLKRENEVQRSQSTTRETGRKLDRMIIG